MGKEEQAKDYFSQWAQFQKSFFNQLTGPYQKMYQPWMQTPQFWTGMNASFPGFDLFGKWNEMISDVLGKSAGKTGTGIGPDVFFRMLGANNVFMVLNEFWMEILKDLPLLHQVKRDDVKTREIFERWVNQYKKVFEQIVGSPISKTSEEMMASWLNTVQMHQAAMGLMWNPWIQVMPKWQEQFEKFQKGDLEALSKARSLWREAYDETLGKVFRMPAFGLTKFQTERVRKSHDAFMQFWYSLPRFYEFIHKTGMDALKQVFDKLTNLKFEEVSPETIRQVYQIWWTTNENAYFELFKSPEFSGAMAEALNNGLRLKKRLDELSADWCKSLSIPTMQEYDELARVVHELRRKLRLQQKTIETLQQKVGKVL